jgi:hypothetical protein
MRVFLVPKTPTASCGPFIPLRTAWNQQRAWHRPGNRCMNGCAGSALFPAHYGTHRVAATPHFSAYRLRERGRSSWTFVQVECHCRYLVAIQRLNEVVNTVIANARPSASPRLRRIPEPQNLLFAQGLERWELRGDYLLDTSGLHWQDYTSGTDEMGPRPGMKSG